MCSSISIVVSVSNLITIPRLTQRIELDMNELHHARGRCDCSGAVFAGGGGRAER